MNRFANPEVVFEGWYPIGRARAFGRGKIRKIAIGKRDVVVYRDFSGELRAVERSCGHLGADLSLGKVVDQGLQCAFHRWCWNADGVCANGARIATYAVRERWGVAWVWAGETPAYDLPMPEPENRAHFLRLPMQRIACHPHVVLGNGLDISHVAGVHRFHFEGEPRMEATPPHRVSVQVCARFHPTLMRHILGLAGKSARWTFTNIGPSLAWVKVDSPTPFELLWAARPLPDGSCATQTLFFLPCWRSLTRAVPMMIATTWADRRVLSGLQFRAGFVPADAIFERYAHLIEGLQQW
ncbi:MAG TPA: Rieske 2Fe-2S domain-containing protein [Thermoanaerobaculia bacterium]|nr:Rieske 2Fe-2S domain-containing protein [Thermoanaerobaculia bacterium]